MGRARHYPGMVQKSPDEAWRPLGIEQSVKPEVSMSPGHQNVDMLGTDALAP
jgi:hypothetical protein